MTPLRWRFIPACAGNRAEALRVHPARAVHPRVCGEQKAEVIHNQGQNGSSPRVRGTGNPNNTADSKCGSSPRVRGTGLVAFGQRCGPRFIPACAGNRPEWRISPKSPAVHPRVCGEQFALFAMFDNACGSSPRVRGTVERTLGRSASDRFIPACAGNRGPCWPVWPRFSVHPRVCGEQSRTRADTVDSVGSSPRVRGTESPRRRS